VVQAYVGAVDPACTRPPKELKVWAKMTVPAGSTVPAGLELDETAFRRWDTATDDWVVEPGDYDIVIAESAARELQRRRVTIA